MAHKVKVKRHTRRRPARQAVDPLMQQATLESHVRYSPEASALQELLHQADLDYKTGVSAETGAAQAIAASAKAADPQIRRNYADAGATIGQTSSDVNAALAKLGVGANPQRAAAAREQAGSTRRLAESQVSSRNELVNRQVDAASGAAFATRNLGAKRDEAKAQVGRRKQALAGEIGAFITSTYGDLKSAEQKQAFDERKLNADIRHQLAQEHLTAEGNKLAHEDRQAGIQQRREAARAKGPGGKNGKKGPSAGAISTHKTVVSHINDAVGVAHDIKAKDPSLSAHQIASLLRGPKGQKNPWGGHGGLSSGAAAQLVTQKYIGHNTLRDLKAEGLLVHRLPRQWTTPPKKKSAAKTFIPWAG